MSSSPAGTCPAFSLGKPDVYFNFPSNSAVLSWLGMHLCGKDVLRFTLEGEASFRKLGSEYLIVCMLCTVVRSFVFFRIDW